MLKAKRCILVILLVSFSVDTAVANPLLALGLRAAFTRAAARGVAQGAFRGAAGRAATYGGTRYATGGAYYAPHSVRGALGSRTSSVYKPGRPQTITSGSKQISISSAGTATVQVSRTAALELERAAARTASRMKKVKNLKQLAIGKPSSRISQATVATRPNAAKQFVSSAPPLTPPRLRPTALPVRLPQSMRNQLQAAARKNASKNPIVSTVELPKVSQKAAMRIAKRQAGIPTSQQPNRQQSAMVDGTKVGRQQTFEVARSGGGKEIKSVQVARDLRGKHAGQPTVEAGKVKIDPLTGKPRLDIAKRPKLYNDKARVIFDP